ncbi:hypothetical protein AA0242T_2095 [Acetobacter aceti NRIC 0242]|uniref:Uncharacterized protein n=1 Tax=Acetobacter aceti NBRC 14818 TaxID=887700 RepID=A0AB33I9Q3_ACEAC|nr:hypothetical protein [Acetobacter aceti]TCS32452.1 hypothetical protein EDC15_1129 [Acetobacter aceti NBRC 14818]BCK74976.1 hypothetical protein EMQ_0582 [Acetobacter aceti NBRC 14818]GAN56932.1 hypothetical protein Abac_012_006 [Acetobacter aceti NBRC 14818]GBO81393.1 hypothetical protein AA0242T_2095 [Acetobacter aceti NRIC 0242]
MRPLTKKEIVQGSLVWVFAGFLVYGYMTSGNPSKQEQPSGPPRTDLIDTAKFSGIPPRKLSIIKKSLSSFLDSCPNIAKYSQHGETLGVYYYPEGWEQTPAHVDVEINLTDESLQAMPQGLRDPQWGGHAEFGLSGGAEPGIIMETPIPEWLCDYPVDYVILSSQERHWDMVKVLMRIPSIQPNAF